MIETNILFLLYGIGIGGLICFALYFVIQLENKKSKEKEERMISNMAKALRKIEEDKK